MATRVLLFATYPSSSNGYSKVAFELAKYLATKQDIALTYWGFQHHMKNDAHTRVRTLPSNVQLYDAVANEKEGGGAGFGFAEVTDFVNMNKPDVVVIYNDMVVVSTIIDQLKKIENRTFKIIVYMDQVYPSQRKEYIERLNRDADMVLCFSQYWEECVKGQGLTKPTGIVHHGFNPNMHFPVPRALARRYFGLRNDDYIILNLNRNQPRKRLDIMMIAFTEFVARHRDDPIKLLIATSLQGAWNLIEIYERELKMFGMTLEEGMKHLIILDQPQGLTDEAINTLHSVANVGINTAMGEGWGLCNFEGAAVGVPQIVARVGGHREFLKDDDSTLITPKYRLYTDMTTDGCPGCAEICDPSDYVDALERYYSDADMSAKHGELARKRILKDYQWDRISEDFYKYIKATHGIDINEPIPIEELDKEKETMTQSIKQIDQDDFKSRLRDRIAKQVKSRSKVSSKDKIKELESKINALMKSTP